MFILYLLIGCILGAVCMWELGYYKKPCAMPVPESIEREKIDITLDEIIRLIGIDMTKDIGSLIVEYGLAKKMPEFYEKYQLLSKHAKELYFNELIDIFSRNRKEDVSGLFDKYPSFTHQDVLLLLMSKMKLDNKTMAKIMGLTLDTLKKRKTRLRLKMRTGGDITAEEAV